MTVSLFKMIKKLYYITHLWNGVFLNTSLINLSKINDGIG